MGQYRDYSQHDDPQGKEGDSSFIGVNARLHPEDVPAGMVAGAYNVRMRDGSLASRLGVSKPGWLNVINPFDPDTPQVVRGVSKFYGSGVWKDPNGFEHVLLASDGDIYRHNANMARKKLLLPGGVEVRACTFCGAFDRVYCFRGRHLAPLVMTDVDTGFEDLVAHWDASAVYAGTYKNGTEPDSTPAQEVAFGPWLDCTISRAGPVVTVATTQPHGYVDGADIVISGAPEPEFNGRWNITVAKENDVTFSFVAAGSTDKATGSPQCSNQSNYWRAKGRSYTVALADITNPSGTVINLAITGHGVPTGRTFYVEPGWATHPGPYLLSVEDADNLRFDPGEVVTRADADFYVTAVTAGLSPATNPDDWQQVWNVLPNADEGVFVNNRLVVPTAYTPGSTDYDASSSWTKKDFLVILDVQDPVHFFFANELRINQGSADEIEQVLKYNNQAVIVLKGTSWGVLDGISGSLASGATSGLNLDMRLTGYGSSGPRAGVVTGQNVLFASPGRGIVGLVQNELGQTRGVDVPFSNEFAREIERINWAAGDKIRLAYWEDRLYVAAPIDGASENNAILVYDFRRSAEAGLMQYWPGGWESVDTGDALCVQEWFVCNIQGRPRLCYIGTDGWVNVMEDCWSGDQVADLTKPDGLGYAEIEWWMISRGYSFGGNEPKRFKRLLVSTEAWAMECHVFAHTGASGEMVSVKDVLLNRTQYLKPVGKADYVEGNTNGDWDTPGRGDYSVRATEGAELAGYALGRWQEIGVRASVRTLAGRYVQAEIMGTGRVKVHTIEPNASEGERRAGILI